MTEGWVARDTVAYCVITEDCVVAECVICLSPVKRVVYGTTRACDEM